MPNSSQDPNHEISEAFLITQYQVAADTYMHGVNIGYTVIRNFVALNAVFFGALGLVNNAPDSNIAQMNGFIKMIPVFAIITSGMLAIAFPFYKKHLNNCSRRCSEIEGQDKGGLFKKLVRIEKNKVYFSAERGFFAIVMLFVIVWSVVAWNLKSWTVLGF